MTLSAQLNRLKEATIDLLFPPKCIGIGCNKPGSFLCPTCLSRLSPIVPPVCPKCGRPLSLQRLCADCEGLTTQIDGIRSVFLFEGVTREAIHHLKYRGLKALAPTLGRLLGDYLRSHPLPAQVLVPVPLHPRRLRERGYNQATLLSRELGTLIDLPLVEGGLVRSHNTLSQARAADAEERRRNVRGVFECRNDLLRGKSVLLIDDVCTTGATLEACAVALKAKGAVSVWGLTLARET